MSGWIFSYDGFDAAEEGRREALCTLGNGFFATRGAGAESVADEVHYPGTYVGGLFNRLEDEVEGRVIENESIVNVPNWLPLSFRVGEGDWFDLARLTVEEYRQELDLRRGVLTRSMRVHDGEGHTTRLVARRFVSMAAMHIAAEEWTIVPEDWSGRLEVRSTVDGRVTNSGVARYRDLSARHLRTIRQGREGDDIVYLEAETVQSGIRVAVAARTRLCHDGEPPPYKQQTIEEPERIGCDVILEVEQGQPVTVEKVAAIYTSRDAAISEPCLAACTEVTRAGDFPALLERHVLGWEHLWRRFDLEADGFERMTLVLRLHIFHVLQTNSLNSIGLDVGVPPRGLHGEAYRGHILWDELFIFLVTTLRMPELTASLLMYRYRRLNEARWLAKEAGYAGAMYPWQSGSTGREESQEIHLNPKSGRWIPDNSHVQRHVNIAIAYNVWHYYQVTDDVEFMVEYGAEMLLEIARFWASIARYNRARDRFEIHGVMGPDEYHDAYPGSDEPGLNNNAYTNVMAAWVLLRAREILERLPAHWGPLLRETLQLKPEEVSRWEDIARKMYVPFHDDGIISQFEGYGELEEFDWQGYSERYGDIQRLDRILEAENDTPNRYKVSKQADVLMLFYLLSADELREVLEPMGYSLPPEAIPRNIQYYLQRTSHGSTLSSMVHSWVLARSNREQSFVYFQEAYLSDVADVQGGTTQEGIHLGAMAGTVDIIQRCYTGVEVRSDVFWINPRLPDEMEAIAFPVRYRGHEIELRVDHEVAHVSTAPHDVAPVQIGYRGEVVTVGPGETHEFPLARDG